MKGIVFTELMELIDKAFGAEVTEAIIERVNPPNGGAYTAVGTYDHSEVLQMVVALSQETAVPVADLVKTFGRHLFAKFASAHAQMFAHIHDAFTFLEGVEGYIHVEVRKLYPDAELPSFETQRPCENTLIMRYSSNRPFADLAEGLIAACCEHFGELTEMSRKDHPVDQGQMVDFRIVRIEE